MCKISDQTMHIMAQMNARALDTGSETSPQEIKIPHAMATEYERNTDG